jgi:hypothetical protein
VNGIGLVRGGLLKRASLEWFIKVLKIAGRDNIPERMQPGLAGV